VNGRRHVVGEHIHRGESRTGQREECTGASGGRRSPSAVPSDLIGLTRFARSTRDSCVHVVAPAGEHSTDGLTARCGQVLSPDVIEHDRPPPGPPCERCRLMFLEDFTAGGAARNSGPTD
jgi:hypothetical protein